MVLETVAARGFSGRLLGREWSPTPLIRFIKIGRCADGGPAFRLGSCSSRRHSYQLSCLMPNA
jgi:hypothetical protein